MCGFSRMQRHERKSAQREAANELPDEIRFEDATHHDTSLPWQECQMP
jgi:hypothetical protein